MTTEKETPQNEVSAPEETVSAEEQIAEEMLAASEAPEVEKKPEPAPAPAFDADELIARVERSVQGRTANTFGQFRKEVRAEIEAALAPVREFTSRIEQAQVEQLDPEQQVEYWKRKAETAQKAPEPEKEPQPQQSQYTSQEQQEITAAVTGMLEFADLDIAIGDPKLWEGYQPGDSPARIKQIARQNIRKLQGAATPQPAATPRQQPETPPARTPSTNGAPRRSASTFTQDGDLYRIFHDSNDPRISTSTQLRDALNERKKNGKVTL